jgi:hypothetical protein
MLCKHEALSSNPSSSQLPVAHFCKLSYSGGRNQEDRGSKPARGNSPKDPISKEPFTKKGWWSGPRHRPLRALSSSPSIAKNKQKTQKTVKRQFRERKKIFAKSYICLFIVVLGFEQRAYTLSHSTSPLPFFVKGFFEIGSFTLFAWGGFKLRASLSLLPE